MSGAYCEMPAIEGKRFCAVHLEQLRRVRGELEAEAKAKTGSGRPPTCQNPGCSNRRIPPAPLCAECADGADDGLAA